MNTTGLGSIELTKDIVVEEAGDAMAYTEDSLAVALLRGQMERSLTAMALVEGFGERVRFTRSIAQGVVDFSAHTGEDTFTGRNLATVRAERRGSGRGAVWVVTSYLRGGMNRLEATAQAACLLLASAWCMARSGTTEVGE